LRRSLSRSFSRWRAHRTQLAHARRKLPKMESRRSLRIISASLGCWEFFARRSAEMTRKFKERDQKRTADLLRGVVSSWRDEIDEAAERKKILGQNDWAKHKLSLRMLSIYFSIWKARIARTLRMKMLEEINHRVCVEAQRVLKTAFLVRAFEQFSRNPTTCMHE
jgi:hypothetical protein